MSAPLAIAQVTPYSWGDAHPVNDHVRLLSGELARLGHDVTIIAPSRSRETVRESRALIRSLAAGETQLSSGREPRLLAVGEAIAASGHPRRSARAWPVDVGRTIETLMDSATFDVVHVHEPWAPSVAASALRHSRALNVGHFHLPVERVVSTQMARKFVELFFGRLDARIAASAATAELIGRHFPGSYDVILPGARDRPAAPGGEELVIGFQAAEERGVLRLLLRALRLIADAPGWRAVVAAPEPATAPRQMLRDRIAFVDELPPVDVLVLGSWGELPAPQLVLDALGAGTVPVASSIPIYEELLGDGDRGVLFPVGDEETLAAQLRGLLAERVPAPAELPDLGWDRVAGEVATVYERLAGRRRDARIPAPLRRRLESRRLIDVDLHMHTDHSYDCATPVEALLAAARDAGLGAIAVTDHNEIGGAKDAAAKCAAYGLKVIVAEEVKTADQGEVIGLFIEQKIPRGMTLAETIAEIKRQGGLVYVPHPFDRLHSVPDYEHLLSVLDDIDAIEVFNARVAIAEFNEEAERFATKYRLAAGAGSDAHVTAGLGSVRIRMRDFEGPEEFLASLRGAEIVRTPASLIYVQALKFLETKATPAAARRARSARRTRRAQRRKS